MSLFMPPVILSRTAYATSFDVHKTVFPLFSLERVPLLFFFFFQTPLLKECHSCSANTEYVFECILSPALIPLPILAWRTHLQPVLYWHVDKAETPDKGLSAQQYTEHTIWPASVINVLYLQSSIVQSRHWVRKTSY